MNYRGIISTPECMQRDFKLTSSATSDFKEEWTPMTNGVGVDNTSTKAAGRRGIYT